MKNIKSKVIVALVVLIIIFGGILTIINLNRQQETITEIKNTPVTTKVSIITPKGAPALAIAGLIEDPNIEVDYEIVDGADVLTSEFTKAEKDLIIAPVNLGNKLISNGAEYKMLGVVSWGNLYIVASDAYFNEVAAFGEAQVPGKILNYVSKNIDDLEFEYFNSVGEVSSMLLSGEYKAALLAEPVLTMANAKFKESNDGKELNIVYNLQNIYKEVSGFESYPQAALFVKKDAIQNHQESILNVVNKMRSSIANYNNNPSAILELKNVNFEELGFKNVELISKAYPKMALNFVYANECVDEIKNFLSIFNMELKDTNYIK